MNFVELKERLQKDDLEFIIAKDLRPKNYLPIIHKQILINKVCEDAISYDENGIAYVDYAQRLISESLGVLLKYCDLEIGEEIETEEIIEVLDLLFEMDVYQGIEEYIGEDLSELKWAIESEIENIKLRNNSLESIVAKGLNKIIGKLPDDKQLKSLSKSVIKDINKLDWDKLPMLKEMWQTANGK